jgi:hypothetical protein
MALLSGKRNECRVLAGKLEGKMSEGLTGKWKGKVKMEREEIGWEVLDWIILAQHTDKLAGFCKTRHYSFGLHKIRRNILTS